MPKISELKNKQLSKKHIRVALDLASGMTSVEVKHKYKIQPYELLKLKREPLFRLIIKERKLAIKQTVMRVFGKFDADYELMVEKYMKRLLEDERIDKTSLMALASIVDTFASIYKKVSEIDTLSKKQLLDLKRYKLEKQHFEILRKMKIGDNISNDNETPNSIIADFYKKLNEMATEDFRQRDIEISEQMKQDMLELDLSNKNEYQLKQMQQMINKQLQLMDEKNTEAENKEINEKRHINQECINAKALEQKRQLEQNIDVLNTNEKPKKHKRKKQPSDEIYEEQERQKNILKEHLENSSDEDIR